MVIAILGGIWILAGLLWCLRPKWGRKALRKRFIRWFRWLFVLIAWATGGLLIWFGRQLDDTIAYWTILVLGIIAIIKGFFFARKKSLEPLLEWWEERPDWVFRLSGLVLFGLGILMQVWSGYWN